VDVELFNVTSQATSKGKATLVWSQSSTKTPPISLEGLNIVVVREVSLATAVGDLTSDSVDATVLHAEGEKNPEVIVGISKDLSCSSAVRSILTDGFDSEKPPEVAPSLSLVRG